METLKIMTSTERSLEDQLLSAARWGDLTRAKEHIQALLLSGRGLNHPDYWGSTPIMLAVLSKKEDMVKLLLKNGANPTIRNKAGKNAICFAEKYRYHHILEMIEDHLYELRKIYETKEKEALAKHSEYLEEERKRKRETEDVLGDNVNVDENLKSRRLRPFHDSEFKDYCLDGLEGDSSSRQPVANSQSYAAPRIPWEHLEVLDSKPVVGEGSSSVVVHAKYSVHGKKKNRIDVAVKILTLSLTNRKIHYNRVRERAFAEADLMYRAGLSIHSDTVAKLYGIVEGPLPKSWQEASNISTSDTVIGIVMKYESGGSLQSLIHGSRKLSMVEKVKILRGVALGLSDLHSLPKDYYIVHGDIKPANVLLSDLNHTAVKLADFGVSNMKEALMNSCDMSVLHSTYTRRGTPVYSAPELLPSPFTTTVSAPSRSSDMYSFAMLAWEILSGKRPFEDVPSEVALCMAVHTDVRPKLDDLPSNTPPGIVDMIRKGFSKDRHERKSADECFLLLDNIFMRLTSSHFDIFFSHPWRDKSFLKYVFAFLASAGYRVWYDLFDMKWDMEAAMDEGIRCSSVVIACINSHYQERVNCMKELRIANTSTDPPKPVVCLVTEGDPFSWASSDLKQLCSFETKLFCDISDLACVDGDAWTNPTKDMVQQLHKLLHPLLRILDDLGVGKSLLPTSS